jgi:hypothetical protein
MCGNDLGFSLLHFYHGAKSTLKDGGKKCYLNRIGDKNSLFLEQSTGDCTLVR